MSDDAFSALMASVDPPLIVLTTAAEGERAGCLVGFHAQSSIAPQHYCVWLSKANHTYRVGLRAAHFVVHFLTAQDLALAERFGTLTGEDTDKFAGVDFTLDDHGVPLLEACPSRISLERIALLDDGGDHVCLTTRVSSAHTGADFVPLRLSGADHLDPGTRARSGQSSRDAGPQPSGVPTPDDGSCRGGEPREPPCRPRGRLAPLLTLQLAS